MLPGYGAMLRGLLPSTVAETSLRPSLAYSTMGSTHRRVALALPHLSAGMNAIGGGGRNKRIRGVSKMALTTSMR